MVVIIRFGVLIVANNFCVWPPDNLPIGRCIVLKKNYTYCLKILLQVYKLKFILNTIYTLLLLHDWLKWKQALLRSILSGIIPVCNEVYRLRARFYPDSFFIYFGTPNALKNLNPQMFYILFSFIDLVLIFP